MYIHIWFIYVSFFVVCVASCSLWSPCTPLWPAEGPARRGRWTPGWRRCGFPLALMTSLWGRPGAPRPRPPSRWWCLSIGAGWNVCVRSEHAPLSTVLPFNTHLVSVPPPRGVWRRHTIGRPSPRWGSSVLVPPAWRRDDHMSASQETPQQEPEASPVTRIDMFNVMPVHLSAKHTGDT